MYFGCIDMGGMKSIAAVIDAEGKILESRKFPTQKGNAREHFRLCSEELLALLDRACLKLEDLYAVGVCAPGMFDYEKGVLMMGPGTGWNHVDVAGAYKSLLNFERVYAESDVRSATMAEAYYGNITNLLWLTLSTGIGGAVIVNGTVMPGVNFCSGELGHNIVEYDNPRGCLCGQKGCAEAYASGTAIDGTVARLAKENSSYRALFRERSLPETAEGCAALAREGEPVSKAVFVEAGMYLGRALSQAINVLNPGKIVIGGGVSLSLDLLLPAVKRVVEQSVVPFSRGTPIEQSALGYHASLQGALVMAKLQSGLLEEEGHWLRYPDYVRRA